MIPFVLVIIAIISYLLGSFNGAIITSRLKFRQDVRNYGSGNAGLTNFHRKYGKKSVLMVVATIPAPTIAAGFTLPY